MQVYQGVHLSPEWALILFEMADWDEHFDNETKPCQCCGEVKPWSDFYSAKTISRKFGLYDHCKKCHNQRQKGIHNKRMDHDDVYQMTQRIRAQLSSWCKRKTLRPRKGEVLDFLGYGPQQFRDHIQAQFESGMSWSNFGEWSIDHVYPIGLAKSIDDLHGLNQLDNLRPLWVRHNKLKMKYDRFLIKSLKSA